MRVDVVPADAVVIGGGFYGAAVAVYLSERRGLRDLVLLEREPALLRRASFNNQARVHSGYHYPRSFTTAYRSRINLPRFLHDWPDAVRRDFSMLYAIAARNSRVNAKQFVRFCHEIGARIRPAEPSLRRLFEPRLIEDVFLVEEYAFDASRLADRAERALRACGVTVRTQCTATAINRTAGNALRVVLRGAGGVSEAISGRRVFNCAYSGLNQLSGDFPGTRARLKQEIAEIALVRPPPRLRELGITLMDGPFFSLMPFPPRGLHSLSHVRYTPHLYWYDSRGVDPYRKLACYDRATRIDRMIRDVQRYLPAMRAAEYVDSLFEVKTVLDKNESDDGRPILFEKYPQLPGCYSVLGGKIDNVYDVLEKLDAEPLATGDAHRHTGSSR
jgi:glycine/D-amino acid oxidase-like deaminating enzyme